MTFDFSTSAPGVPRGTAAASTSPREDAHRRSQGPVRLYVSLPRRAGSSVPGLARLLKLAVWDTSLLTRSASTQMAHAAELLVIVFLFEWAMWTLLFNTVLYLRPLHVGAMTPGAAALGLLFAWAVIVWESSVVTADLPSMRTQRLMPQALRRGYLRKPVALGGRFVLVLASAFATAQALELFVFNGAIENRLKEETVLAEALLQAGDQQDDLKAAAGKSRADVQADLEGTIEGKERAEAATSLEAARERVKQAEAAQIGATTRRNAASSAFSNARSRHHALRTKAALAPPASRPQAEADRDRAETMQRNASIALANARSTLELANEEVADATAALASATDRLSAATTVHDRLVDGALEKVEEKTVVHKTAGADRKEWLNAIQRARYDTIPRPRGQAVPATFSWKEADFLDRLKILSDLTAGRPPRWPPSDHDQRAKAIDLFGLPNHSTGDRSQEKTDEAWMLWQAYLISFVVALIIPLLALGFKVVLIGPELEAYYSCWSQARAGNPDALAVLSAQGFDLEAL